MIALLKLCFLIFIGIPTLMLQVIPMAVQFLVATVIVIILQPISSGLTLFLDWFVKVNLKLLEWQNKLLKENIKFFTEK